MDYYACWMNGSEVQAGPYKEGLGKFDILDLARQAFIEWRKNHPSFDGWKHDAWLEDEEGNKYSLALEKKLE